MLECWVWDKRSHNTSRFIRENKFHNRRGFTKDKHFYNVWKSLGTNIVIMHEGSTATTFS